MIRSRLAVLIATVLIVLSLQEQACLRVGYPPPRYILGRSLLFRILCRLGLSPNISKHGHAGEEFGLRSGGARSTYHRSRRRLLPPCGSTGFSDTQSLPRRRGQEPTSLCNQP